MTNVGVDCGNRRFKIHINGKNASIPSTYAFDRPIVRGPKGMEIKAKAYNLLFNVDGSKSVRLWFGQDVLISQSSISKIDEGKYEKFHIQRLFLATLYQWGKQHKVDMSSLGKLNICVSMPAGSYGNSSTRKLAETSYKKAFNTGQSHMKLRDGKDTVQIVSRFHSLIRETVSWGMGAYKENELVLVIDLGGGTDDIALFNGTLLDNKTYNTGLIHTYRKINPTDPNQAELRIFKDKSYFPNELLSYLDQKETMVRMVTRSLRRPVDKIYFIGGGASIINRERTIKNTFLSLAQKVVIKDQYANAEANYKYSFV